MWATGIVLALLCTSALPLPVAAARPVPAAPTSSILLQGGFSHFIMDPFRDRLYVADFNGGKIIVWNTTTDRAIANVTVDGGPYGMDVSADGSELYVALTTALALGVVDLHTLTSLGRIHLSATPEHVAAGRPGRAYVTVAGQWTYPLIVDTTNRKEIGNITQASVIYGGGFALASRDRTTLYITTRYLSPESIYKFSIVTDPPTLLSVAPFDLVGANLGDIDLTLDGSHLYVACGGPSGSGYYVQGISTSDWSTSATLYTGPYPNSVGLDQRGWIAFTANTGTAAMAFNSTNMTRIGVFQFSQEVSHVRTVPDGTKIYALTKGTQDRIEVAATGFSPTSNEPPIVRASSNATRGYAPLRVAFGAAVILGAPPFNYTWEFGDGGTSYAPYANHEYAAAGTFRASVTVRDHAGYHVSDALSIVTTQMPLPNPLQVGKQFAGIGFGFTNFWVPPDPQIAAGPDHLVEMVNARVLMTTKDGGRVQEETIQHFFRMTDSEYLSDPKVQFDAPSGRWFATVFDLGQGTVLLAVSSDADPTKPWNVQTYLSASGCPDQPILGVAGPVVIVSANDYSTCQTSGTFDGAEYWVINKTGLVQNTSNDFVHFGPDPNLFSIHAAQAVQPSTSAYLVSAGDGVTRSSNLTLFHVTGVPPAAVNVTVRSLTIRPFIQPPNAVQPATTLKVNTGDSRIQDAFLDGGSLWVAFTSACSAVVSGTNRSCVRILALDPVAGSVLQDFDVSDPNRDLFYPALRTDSSGNLIMVFGISSTADYPGIMLSTQLVGDPANTFRLPVFLRRGAGQETTGCGPDGSCRYGDYFGAARDPVDPSLLWVVGETGGFSGWQTAIAGVGIFPTVRFTLSYSIKGGGTSVSPPLLTSFSAGGKKVQSLSTNPTIVDIDRDSTWNVTGLLSGSSETERWITDMTTAGRASEAATIEFVYRHQVWLTVSSATPGGTVSPSSGWQDGGKTVDLMATASTGWQFAGWEGHGPGSYTGSANPVSVPMNGVVNETARFTAGLTISVGSGGSVSYSYANVTGVIEGGAQRTIFVPPGTEVHLQASPSMFNRFVAWTEGISGTGSSASLRVDAPVNASATFASDVGAAALPLGGGLSIALVAVVAALLVRRRRRRKPFAGGPSLPEVPPPPE